MEYLFINCVFEGLYPPLKRKVLSFSLLSRHREQESALAFLLEWWGRAGACALKREWLFHLGAQPFSLMEWATGNMRSVFYSPPTSSFPPFLLFVGRDCFAFSAFGFRRSDLKGWSDRKFKLSTHHPCHPFERIERGRKCSVPLWLAGEGGSLPVNILQM